VTEFQAAYRPAAGPRRSRRADRQPAALGQPTAWMAPAGHPPRRPRPRAGTPPARRPKPGQRAAWAAGAGRRDQRIRARNARGRA